MRSNGSIRVRHTSLLALIAIVFAPTVIAQWPPNDEKLRGSLSDIHLEVMGGMKKIRHPQMGGSSMKHAMMIAEGRDVEWAEAIEPRIENAVSNRPEADKFELLGIECGTSICEIQVIGIDYESLASWDRVESHIKNQTWNDFNQMGYSSWPVDGRLVILSHWFREDSQFNHCFVNPDEGTCPDPTALNEQ